MCWRKIIEKPANERELEKIIKKDVVASIVAAFLAAVFLVAMFFANDALSVFRYGFLFMALVVLSVTAYFDGLAYSIELNTRARKK